MHFKLALENQIPRIKRTVLMGMKSLWNHRLRSLLTVLGIVFGVCSVIAMLAIGEGASFEAQEQIRQLGSNNIILRSVKPPDEQSTSAQRSFVIDYGLTYADLRRFRDTIPDVEIIVPGRIIRKDVWSISRRMSVEVTGTVPWYPEMTGSRITEGRFFNNEEMGRSLNVTVIDTNMMRELFPLGSPVGDTVRIDREYYRVIGVIDSSRRAAAVQQASGGTNGTANSSATSAKNGTGTSATMLIPLTAAKNRFGETLVNRGSGSMSAERVELHEAIVQVHNQDQVVETALLITDMLAAHHSKQDYEVVVPLELLRQAERTKRIFNIVLGAIAGISLVVGGIGIMNIMLASVTERTREIGIRRALGAKRRDIIMQFLIETILLSATGGIIGVIMGVAIPFFITYFAEMVTIVTFWSPMIAFSISAMVGLVFGIYPAIRAADMDPVEALRHE